MRCNTCKTLLSINDVDRNTWNNIKEEFVVICPRCKTEQKIVSYLFEFGHITNPFLEMLVEDSDNESKEKNLSYVPEEQRTMLLEHLRDCKICSDRMEQIRLINLSHSLLFNKDTYDFFVSRAKDVYSDVEYKMNCVGLKSFVFEGTTYTLSRKDLFYESMTGETKLWCYFLEKDTHSVGMASFLKYSKGIILERIWLKSEKRIIKERQFLEELKIGNVRNLLSTVSKSI
ncbi:MAG: hypothetical protein PHF86_06785 [Candidatus Nanoarchaeia archaeon]|jgi:hypothetical protein|nr:hypothetical protein [Candidatus Nanoarchaeia archaeon]